MNIKVKNSVSRIKENYFRFKESPSELFNFLLTEVVNATESENGFVAEVFVDLHRRHKMKILAFSNISWNKEIRDFYDKNAPRDLIFKNMNTLFGRVIETGETVISNNPKKDSKLDTLPKGHPQLKAFMGVPIYHRNELVGIFGLSNKKDGYDSELVYQLTELVDLIGDIIYFHQEERRVKQTESFNYFYKHAIDSCSIIAFTDANGDITYANDKFCEISKYTASELIGKNHRIINSGYHDKSFFKELWDTISSGKTWSGEIRNKAKDGSIYWVDTTIVPYRGTDGKIEKYISIRKDITLQKEQQESIDHALEKAQHLADEKSQFLNITSHEIRTPLNGIIGISNVLKKTQLTREQQHYLNVISRSSAILLNIVNDILDYSKVEAGKMDLEDVEFNVNHFFNSLMVPHKYAAETKGIELIIDMERIPFYLIADSGRIGQIANNLVSNAVKFTTHGHVKFSMHIDDEKLYFQVKDTGIGIPKESQERMFKAFNQAEASISRKYGGTGLGLSICKKLTDLMQGKIHFESETHKHTTFFVEIPVKHGKLISEAESLKILSPRAIPDKLVGNILVAEDNTINQLVISKILEDFGLNYHIVADGDEVIDSLREVDYDLILMDCQMPNVDGFEATSKIRNSISINNEIPIIALTANVQAEVKQKCFDIGMNDYIVKPITEENLYQAMAKVLPLKENIKRKKKKRDFSKIISGKFLVNSQEYIECLEENIVNKDYDSVANICHLVRPSAEILGLRELVDLATEVELQIKEGKLDAIGPKLDKLLRVYIMSCDKLLHDPDAKSLCVDEREQTEQVNTLLNLNRVAYIEDDESMQEIVKLSFSNLEDLKLEVYSSAEESLEKMHDFSPELILIDTQLPGMSGIELFKHLEQVPETKHVPKLFYTGEINHEELLDMKPIGVLSKSTPPTQLVTEIKKILDQKKETA